MKTNALKVVFVLAIGLLCYKRNVIVMLDKRLNFVEAVEFLSGIVTINRQPKVPVISQEDR